MRSEGLLPLVGVKLGALLGGYIEAPEIVPPKLGTRRGCGAIALAQLVMSLLRSSAPRAHAVAIVKDALNSVWKMARNWKIQVVALLREPRHYLLDKETVTLHWESNFGDGLAQGCELNEY